MRYNPATEDPSRPHTVEALAYYAHPGPHFAQGTPEDPIVLFPGKCLSAAEITQVANALGLHPVRH